ncbi:helix-turn-helix transcriptional regulator [Lutispora sp.]|uniref:helix-turn-helix transcriptional regulator n=1 Tax=Lutispora sp. TaxID=2828727 RepID=UPI002B1F60A8|nr:helix-turn-helix transcriptional regulator [Lutispora sp.]MEA4962098.1 helix-turn-helix transcriptional regulator [Lutispora sp.]
MKRTLNQNVELIRESKGVTKTFLANKLGLTAGGYNHISNGSTEISAERLKIISDILGEGMEIFFNDELTDMVISKYNSLSTKTKDADQQTA